MGCLIKREQNRRHHIYDVIHIAKLVLFKRAYVIKTRPSLFKIGSYIQHFIVSSSTKLLFSFVNVLWINFLRHHFNLGFFKFWFLNIVLVLTRISTVMSLFWLSSLCYRSRWKLSWSKGGVGNRKSRSFCSSYLSYSGK